MGVFFAPNPRTPEKSPKRHKRCNVFTALWLTSLALTIAQIVVVLIVPGDEFTLVFRLITMAVVAYQSGMCFELSLKD